MPDYNVWHKCDYKKQIREEQLDGVFIVQTILKSDKGDTDGENAYKRNHSIGVLITVSEGESMTIMTERA